MFIVSEAMVISSWYFLLRRLHLSAISPAQAGGVVPCGAAKSSNLFGEQEDAVAMSLICWWAFSVWGWETRHETVRGRCLY